MSDGPPRLTEEQASLVRGASVVGRLVPYWKRRTQTVTEGELTSVGNESLLRAALHYDASRGVPFGAYAFRCVYLDMKRHVIREGEHNARISFEPAWDYLDAIEDPGNLWEDTPVDAANQLRDFVRGLRVAVSAELLANASLAPSEDELVAHLDWKKSRERLLEVIDGLGERGEVVKLRYFDRLDWDGVAKQLNVSLATAKRHHQAAVKALAAELCEVAQASDC